LWQETGLDNIPGPRADWDLHRIVHLANVKTFLFEVLLDGIATIKAALAFIRASIIVQ
jgi:hypothetical protein